jgi:hypothetical protein
METDELIKLIEAAFPTHPLPEDTLRQATLSDQGMSRKISRAEWESAGRIDRDVPWTALSDSDLMECQDGISHLVGPEFRYYLGALLRFAARYLDAGIGTPEGSLVRTVLYSVTHQPGESESEWRLRQYVHARWATLDATQIKVVQRFLEYVAERSERYRMEANRALDRYWNEAREKEPDYCPVCAYALPFGAWSEASAFGETCPCCGIRFGYDDAAGGSLVRGTIYRDWRARWFNAGMPWRSRNVHKPEGWTPAAQLARLREKG